MRKILLGILILIFLCSSVMAVELVRQKNAATYIFFPIIDADGDVVSVAAGLDSEIDTWGDGGAPDGFTNCTNEATEIGSNGWYYLSLTAAEMNADYIAIQVKTTTSGAKTQHILIRTINGDPLKVATVTANYTIDVAATGEVGVNLDNITGTLDAGEIGANAITAAKIADDAIDYATFAATAPTAWWNEGKTGYGLADDAITAAKIATDAITSDKIAAATIGASELAANAITSDEIADGAIDAGAIADDAIDAGAIADDAIDAGAIADDAIDYATFAATAPSAWWNEGKTGYSISGTKTTLDALNDLSTSDNIGINWADVSNPTSTVSFTNTTIATVTTATSVTNEVTADAVKISGSSDAADYLEEAFDGDSVVTGAKLELEQLYINGSALTGESRSVYILNDDRTVTIVSTDDYGLDIHGSADANNYAGFYITGGGAAMLLDGGTGYDDLLLTNGTIGGTIDSANAVGVGTGGITNHSLDSTAINEQAEANWNVDTSGAWNGELGRFGEWNAQAQVGTGGGSTDTTTIKLMMQNNWDQDKNATWDSVENIVESISASTDTSKIKSMLQNNYDSDTDGEFSVEAASCYGSGARTVVIQTLNAADSSTGISGFEIDVEDSVAGEHVYGMSTNASGLCTLSLDDATWTVKLHKTPWSITSPVYPIVSSDTTLTYYATAFDPGTPSSASKCRIYVVQVTNVGAVAQSGCKLSAWINRKYLPVTSSEGPVTNYSFSAISDDTGHVKLEVYRSANLTAGDETSTVKYNLRIDDANGKMLHQRFDVEIPDQASWEIDWTP